MALLWFDGFDHYTNTNSTSGFDAFVAGIYSTDNTNVVGSAEMPELGSRAFRASGSGVSGVGIRWLLGKSDTTDGTYGLGFHLYIGTLQQTKRFAGFTDSVGTIKFQIGANSSGQLEIYSGSGTGAILATGSNQVPVGELLHFEIKIIQHPTEGSIEVRVNGQTWVVADNINTSTGISSFFLRSSSGTGTANYYYDNLYFWDGTGDDNNDWLGERNVYTLMPASDGSETDWVLSTGSDGYALINGVPPGSGYIEALNVGDVSSFGLGDLPTTDINIIGMRMSVSASKTGTSLTEIAFGPGSERGAPFALTQDQYLRGSEIWENNPDTDEPWTPGEINSLEIELERVT